jgi:DNA polymerase-3 subunit epsilon
MSRWQDLTTIARRGHEARVTELERMAQKLEASGDYRVLRRLKARTKSASPAPGDAQIGLFLDVETTGLDLARSEVIELAIVPFEFTREGQIFRTCEPLAQLNEPSEPIPAEITALTGLTDEDVTGHRFDLAAIEAMLDPAALIVAHNAAFDRPFAERISSLFKAKPWACSMTGVPWRSEGIYSRRLSDLLATFGLFFDSHRAEEDCLAAIELLTMSLPSSGKSVMSALLESARIASYRISAERAPFEAKEKLKLRGYRWNGDVGAGPRVWSIEVGADKVERELLFLEEEVFYGPADVPITKITAFERFSMSGHGAMARR